MVEVKIKKRGKYYFKEYVLNGKRYRKSLKATDKMTALALALEFQHKLLRQEFGQPDENRTLGESVEAYLKQSETVKSNTSISIEKHILRLLISFLEEGRLEINEDHPKRHRELYHSVPKDRQKGKHGQSVSDSH